MGTSSARRGPTTWFWRRAKGAATRYLAPEGEVRLEAREVVARYLAALEESAGAENQRLLGVFRLTRKTAQNLGDFVGQAATQGWEATLEAWGLAAEAGQPGELVTPALAGVLLEPDGSLEDAVARSSLAAVIQEVGSARQDRPARVVTKFLAESLYQRLVLDLGEPLEAASRNFGQWRQGLEGLRTWIAGGSAAAESPEPPTPEQWRGLAGWNWVTLTLESLLRHLLTAPSPPARPLGEGGNG